MTIEESVRFELQQDHIRELEAKLREAEARALDAIAKAQEQVDRAWQAKEHAEREREAAQRSAESAVQALGAMRDELVSAGYPGGDREVALANLRQLVKDRNVMRAHCRSLVRVLLVLAPYPPEVAAGALAVVDGARAALGEKP